MIEVNPSILGVQVVTFLIALFVVWKLAWKPIIKILSDREELVRKSIADAEKARQTLEDAIKSQKDIIAKADNDAQLIIQSARETAQNLAMEIGETARREAERMVESAQKAISSHKEQAIRELRTEAATIAVMAASKLIAVNLDDERNRSLVNSYIAELTQK